MTGFFIYDVEGKSCPARLVDGIPEIVQVNDFDYQTFPFQITMKCFNGDKIWYMNGKLHRLDGPAIEYANGDKSWYKNHKLHREDGPAIEYTNGKKSWYMNGKHHRLDGPAIEYANGDKLWWINGEKVKESDYPAAVEEFIASKVLV